MIVVGVDTSVNFESITVLHNGEVVDQANFRVKSHSPVFIPNLLQILEKNSITIDSIDGWGVAIGPGSFTGLRIGLASILGITFRRDVPVVGVITLRAMALSTGREGYISPVIDARKGEIYTALYRVEGKKISVVKEERVINPAKWLEMLPNEEIYMTGDGLTRYGDILLSRDNLVKVEVVKPVSYGVAIIAVEEIKRGYRGKPVEPFYIRKSDAEINFEKKKREKIE